MTVDEEKENGVDAETEATSDEQAESSARDTEKQEPEADAGETTPEDESAEGESPEAGPEAEVSNEDEAASDDAANGESTEDAGAATQPAARPSRKKRSPEEKAARRAARKRRRVEARPETRKPIVRLAKPEQPRGARKERVGVVVGDAMDRTITVKVERAFPHRRYGKVIRRTTKFYAHDAENSASVGDRVRIVETRPLSKNKRWRLTEIVETAR